MAEAAARRELAVLAETIPACDRCPELRAYCRDVAREKRRAFLDWDYWGRPVPGFGDPGARIVIVGLAPGAHGANRTGRVFTGDRSGDFLYAALYRAGLANQPESRARDDGLALDDVYVTAAARCAPPANKPTAAQLANCASYLVTELRLLRPKVIIALGGIGWKAMIAALRELGVEIPRPRPAFGHGTAVALGDATCLGCYHVSQQNTFTGRLTPPMLDAVLEQARDLAGGRGR